MANKTMYMTTLRTEGWNNKMEQHEIETYKTEHFFLNIKQYFFRNNKKERSTK